MRVPVVIARFAVALSFFVGAPTGVSVGQRRAVLQTDSRVIRRNCVARAVTPAVVCVDVVTKLVYRAVQVAG